MAIMTKNEKMEFAAMIAEAVVGALKAEPTSAKNAKSTSRGNANEGKKPEAKAEKTAKYSTSIKDYEPKKDADGYYKWGRKTDTVKSKNYLAMQKAYCYAVATKGKAITSDECFKNGIEVDYGTAYNKAKEDFKKKYAYVAKGARN